MSVYRGGIKERKITPGQIQKIKTLQGKRGLDDALYREMLRGLGGVDSSTKLDQAGARRVIDRLEGDKEKAGHRPGMATPGQLDFIEKLWSQVSRAEDKAAALRSFIKKLYKVDDIRWLTIGQGSNLIQRLKLWKKQGSGK